MKSLIVILKDVRLMMRVGGRYAKAEGLSKETQRLKYCLYLEEISGYCLHLLG